MSGKFLQIAGLLILVAMLAVGVFSCSKSAETRRLEAADAVMEEAPDSAFRILMAIDTALLRSERERHLRDLLLAQARVKLDLEGTDTARLRLARDWFTEHPEKNYRLRSNFYMGDIAHDDSSFIAAAGYAADAFLEASDRRDSYWTAKSAELISHISNNCEFPEASVKYDSIAAHEYWKANKDKNALYCKIDMAKALGSLKRYNEADRLFKVIIERIGNTMPADTSIALYALRPSIRIKLELNDIAEAGKLLNMLKEYKSVSHMNALDLIFISWYEMKKGDYMLSKDLLDSSYNRLENNYEREYFYKVGTELASLSGDSAGIIRCQIGSIPILTDTDVFRKENPITTVLDAKVNDYEKAKEKDRHNSELFQWMIISILAFAGILGIIYLYLHIKKFRKMRENNMSLGKLMSEIQEEYNGPSRKHGAFVKTDRLEC